MRQHSSHIQVLLTAFFSDAVRNSHGTDCNLRHLLQGHPQEISLKQRATKAVSMLAGCEEIACQTDRSFELQSLVISFQR